MLAVRQTLLFVAALTLVLGNAACEREPIEVDCPPVAPGELVVSEVNAAGSLVDDDEQWIELYNATGDDVVLAGAVVRLRTLNGSRDERIVIRSRDVVVPAEGYAVLGNFEDQTELQPAYVDYGYLSDFDGNLPEPVAIDVQACDGLLIDRVIARDLPSEGTLSLNGVAAPDASTNDEADPRDPGSFWCADAETTDDAFGTPGAGNRPCPAEEDAP